MKKTMIACAALLLMAVHGMAQTEKPLTDEEIAAVRAWMASHPEDGSQKKIQEGTKEDNFLCASRTWNDTWQMGISDGGE